MAGDHTSQGDTRSPTASPRPACGDEGVGPFAGMYCVLNEGHPRPPGHVYAPPGTDRIDHLDTMLIVADETWKREAELRNDLARTHETLRNAALPLARLPHPVSSDERVQWLTRQQKLREVLGE